LTASKPGPVASGETPPSAGHPAPRPPAQS
jgi:hypothetical protein